MFMCRSMKYDLRMVFIKYFFHEPFIFNISDTVYHLGVIIEELTAFRYTFDQIIDGVLPPPNHNNTFDTEFQKLPAYLRPDASSGPGNQNGFIKKLLLNHFAIHDNFFPADEVHDSDLAQG